MLIIPAHAKINLCLTVRGRRPDGYHEIDSVATTIDWHDLVGLSIRPADATAIRLRVTGDGAHGAPVGEENLAWRAAMAIAASAGPLDVDIWLYKRIPGQAGLGGGSADAAAVLRAVNALLEAEVGGAALAAGAATAKGAPSRPLTPLDSATLYRLAASLGTDVPLALAGGTQRMGGRGDELAPLPTVALHVAVVLAGSSGTAAAYAAARGSDDEGSGRVDGVAAAIIAGRSPAPADLGSGLEAPACRAQPGLGTGLAALRAALPQVRWHLTGSGGAAFALVADAGAATELVAAAAGFAGRACRTVAAPPSPRAHG